MRDLPESGHRLKLAPLPETADSLALSQLALSARASRRTLAIVCADALATARLAAEIAWFAPSVAYEVEFHPPGLDHATRALLLAEQVQVEEGALETVPA